MNKLVSHIQAILVEIITEIYKVEINKSDISLETPPKKELGDYAFPCFWLSKTLKKWPPQIAQEIIDFVKNNEKYNIFSSLEVAWPYLNLRLDKAFLSSYFIENHRDILNLKDKSNEDKTIVIDYIWANVWKPLHIGHMCTPNQWQVLINLFEKMGYKVISDSHFGDWGWIFGKLIYAWKYLINSDEFPELNEKQSLLNNLEKFEEWKNTKLYSEWIDFLLKLYQLTFWSVINAEIPWEIEKSIEILNNKKLEKEQWAMLEFKYLSWNWIDLSNEEEKKHHEENVELWKRFTGMSISETEKTLEILNIKSKYNIWESFYEWLNLPRPNNEDYPKLTYDMNQIVDELLKLKIATKNEDGSVWVVFPEETKMPSCILQKRDWTHGYLASDLACVKYRMQNWNPLKIIYFVDVRQQLHLKQVFAISKMAGWIDDKTELFHAANWFISLKDGAMSTRKWRIIKLEALLDEGQDRAKEIIKEKRDDIRWDELDLLAIKVWIWAIKYWYLSKNRTLDTIFDWDEFMTFEWNSWPYIQYAYVRARNILQNAQWLKDTINVTFDYDEEIDLAKELFNYKTILAETSTSYYPHLICNYVYNLTKKFNSFYNKVHILSEENEDKKQLKLLLIDQFSQVLKNSFEILWIEMPDKM